MRNTWLVRQIFSKHSLQCVGGALFGGGSLLALARFSDAGFGPMPQIVASAFFAVGAYLLWRGWRVRQACLLLRRQ